MPLLSYEVTLLRYSGHASVLMSDLHRLRIVLLQPVYCLRSASETGHHGTHNSRHLLT